VIACNCTPMDSSLFMTTSSGSPNGCATIAPTG
jgi:hypothetical protein